jgi:hypothetical protein
MTRPRTLLTAAAFAAPLALVAQRPPTRMEGNAPRRPPVSALLDARRELELTPRQVTRLDSLERLQYRRMNELRGQMRQLSDSLCASQTRCELTSAQRDLMRDRMQRMRSSIGDSATRALAWSLLDSTQRGRVEGAGMARGFARGVGPRGRFAPQRGEFGPGFGAPGRAPRAWRGNGWGRDRWNGREPGWGGPQGRSRQFGPGRNVPPMPRGRWEPWDDREPLAPRMRMRRPGGDEGPAPADTLG